VSPHKDFSYFRLQGNLTIFYGKTRHPINMVVGIFISYDVNNQVVVFWPAERLAVPSKIE
jgi:hypothetical protein